MDSPHLMQTSSMNKEVFAVCNFSPWMNASPFLISEHSTCGVECWEHWVVPFETVLAHNQDGEDVSRCGAADLNGWDEAVNGSKALLRSNEARGTWRTSSENYGNVEGVSLHAGYDAKGLILFSISPSMCSWCRSLSQYLILSHY